MLAITTTYRIHDLLGMVCSAMLGLGPLCAVAAVVVTYAMTGLSTADKTQTNELEMINRKTTHARTDHLAETVQPAFPAKDSSTLANVFQDGVIHIVTHQI